MREWTEKRGTRGDPVLIREHQVVPTSDRFPRRRRENSEVVAWIVRISLRSDGR